MALLDDLIFWVQFVQAKILLKMKTYTIRQVAEICHCHHSTILEHIHSGSLKP